MVIRRDKPVVMVDFAPATDPDLSLSAKGLMIHLQVHDYLNFEEAISELNDPSDVVLDAINELVKWGYLKRDE